MFSMENVELIAMLNCEKLLYLSFRCSLYSRKHFFTVRVTKHWHRVPRLWSLHPWRYSKSVGMWSWATRSRWLSWGRGLDKMSSRNPFQPQPFCDFV